MPTPPLAPKKLMTSDGRVARRRGVGPGLLQALEQGRDLIGGEGFGQELGAAGAHGLEQQVGVAAGGKGDDGDLAGKHLVQVLDGSTAWSGSWSKSTTAMQAFEALTWAPK